MLDCSEINNLLKNLSSYAPKNLQDQTVELLVKMDESQVYLLIPYITEQHCWPNLNRVLIGLGYSKIKAIMPDLLELLQDINYSGSKEAAKLLIQLGEPIIPYVREVLYSEDVYWKYYVLTKVVEFWPTEFVKKLEKEIYELTNVVDYENGLHIDALRILLKKGIGDKDGLKRKFNFLTDRYKYFIEKLRAFEGDL